MAQSMPRRDRHTAALSAIAITLAGLIGASLGGGTAGAVSGAPTHRSTWSAASISSTLAGLPISFETNRGQASPGVRFLARGSGYTLLLSPTDAVMRFAPAAGHDAAVRLHLLGANPHPGVVGLNRLPGTVNYFIGNKPSRWRTNIPTYGRVEYRDVYPGINLVFYGRQGHLEYDWVVKPGSSAQSIRVRIQGTAVGQRSRVSRLPLWVDRRGDLVAGRGAAALRQLRPAIYQQAGSGRTAISGRYVLDGKDTVRFQVGSYDTHRPLVIDPVLVYSTYLGGSGNDVANGIAVDAAGNAYITGNTDSPGYGGTILFPTTPGALQTTKPGSSFSTNAFVSKINTNASGAPSLVYSTYLGGSGFDDSYAIAIDPSGNAYVTGDTSSFNFPTTSNAFQPHLYSSENVDAFVTKLNSTGSGLLYSTFLGGPGGDYGRGIAVDAAGNAYVTGYTYSSQTSFPTTPNAFQRINGGYIDAFVSRINTTLSGTASLVYSTYLGGSNGDLGEAIATDGAGIAYVTGYTYSQYNVDRVGGFPVTPTAYQSNNTYTTTTYADAFITLINSNSSGSASLMYSTYFGGALQDQGSGIAIDSSKNVYFTGATYSTDFPTTPNAYQRTYAGNLANHTNNAFVAKLNPSVAGKAGLVYSTYLGGSSGDSGAGIAVDGAGNAYVTGVTASSNFPTFNTSHKTLMGTSDAFVTVLSPAGNSLIFSTYLGGAGGDAGNGIAVDPAQNFYVTGSTSSPTDFPHVNQYQSSLNGGQNAFVSKFSPGPTAARVARFTAHRSGSSVLFRWRMASSTGVAAFNLYAGRHRLNPAPIASHASRAYRYTARWTGAGPFTLQVVLTDGQEVRAHTRA